MKLNLIIDGNYILSKLTFTLHKHKLLYGALYDSLHKSYSKYKLYYPFDGTYFISDSKEPSWRKKLLGTYKSTRTKDQNIDWEFVYNTYDEFKKSLPVKVIESNGIEADDFISYIIDEKNKKGESCLVISNDYDLKQKLDKDINSGWINIMMNEMFNKEKVFLPKGYKLFIESIRDKPNYDLFNLDGSEDFVKFFDNLVNKSDIHEVDSRDILLNKIISGDSSDNIKSVWFKKVNGVNRGIGEKGAQTIIEIYKSEFGEINIEDPDIIENISDIICEKKKLSRSEIPKISDNIRFNKSIIQLTNENLPSEVLEKIKEVYEGRR